MREPKFRKGDIVTFKSWDDMAAEYGSPYNVPFQFCVEMQHLCGKSFKVHRVEWLPHFDTYKIDLINNEGMFVGIYNYSEEMFVDPLLTDYNDEVYGDSTITTLF